MALVVENGTGRADAESPNSLAEIGDYLACFALPALASRWQAAAELVKERAARDATRFMEARYGYRVPGQRRVTEQALSFPVVGGFDARNLPIPADAVPVPWKQAHAELSVRALDAELEPDLQRGGRLSSFSIGPSGPDRTSESRSYEAGAPAGTTFSKVESILATLLYPAGRQVRA